MKPVKSNLGGEQAWVKWLCILMPEYGAGVRKTSWLAGWNVSQGSQLTRVRPQRAMGRAGPEHPANGRCPVLGLQALALPLKRGRADGRSAVSHLAEPERRMCAVQWAQMQVLPGHCSRRFRCARALMQGAALAQSNLRTRRLSVHLTLYFSWCWVSSGSDFFFFFPKRSQDYWLLWYSFWLT